MIHTHPLCTIYTIDYIYIYTQTHGSSSVTPRWDKSSGQDFVPCLSAERCGSLRAPRSTCGGGARPRASSLFSRCPHCWGSGASGGAACTAERRNNENSRDGWGRWLSTLCSLCVLVSAVLSASCACFTQMGTEDSEGVQQCHALVKTIQYIKMSSSIFCTDPLPNTVCWWELQEAGKQWKKRLGPKGTLISKIFIIGCFEHRVQTPVNWCLCTNYCRLIRNKFKNCYIWCEKIAFVSCCAGVQEKLLVVLPSLPFDSKMTLGKSLWLPVPALISLFIRWGCW